MILKWIDYSGAAHVISGVEEAVSYGSRHISEARALADYMDGEDAVLEQMIGPDVWRSSIADAVELGHTTLADRQGSKSLSTEGPAPAAEPLRGDDADAAVERNDTIRRDGPGGNLPYADKEIEQSRIQTDDHLTSIAVWTNDRIDADGVTVIQTAVRSFGQYVIIKTGRDPVRRRHLLIDCSLAWLMNDAGTTVDRLGTDQ